ncbi:hepatitis A virus cellular receptor 1-like, partial [Sigmodon hispidus]
MPCTGCHSQPEYLLIVLQVNIMMHLQVFVSGIILFLPTAVESFPKVHGVVSHPVTLPCTYPISLGISSMCWGRGACSSDKCKDVVILTNGYYVYYKRNNRYQLKGQLLQGNLSLTIENVTESDSGLYCCRVEMKKWTGIQRLTISLQVQADHYFDHSPRRAMTFKLIENGGHSTGNEQNYHMLPPIGVNSKDGIIEVEGMGSEIFSQPSLWIGSLTCFCGSCWEDRQGIDPTEHPPMIMTKGFYIGISIALLLLLLGTAVVIMMRCIFMKKKPGSLRATDVCVL